MSEPFLRGMQIAMELVGAAEGVIGIKEKYHEIIEALEQSAPAGDSRGSAAGYLSGWR